MGTPGYLVYRYNGVYFIYFYRFDSYPDALGLEALSQIPVKTKAFNKWASAKMKELTEQLAQHDVRDDESSEEEHGECRIARTRPRNGTSIEWIYELDFDNLAFHINGRPMFKLDCRPPSAIFEECISTDSYGHMAPSLTTPYMHRYIPTLKAKAAEGGDGHSETPAPSIAFDSTRQNNSTLHELLDIREALTDQETVREAFLQALIGQFLRSYHVGPHIPWLPAFMEREELPPQICNMAYNLLQMVFAPFFIRSTHRPSDHLALKWLRGDIFLWFAADLSSPSSQQKAVDASVRELETCPKQGTIFGILFSVLDVVIVRLDTSGDRKMVAHTAAFPFLPDQYAMSPSTSGITAVARLAAQADPTFMLKAQTSLAACSVLPPQNVSSQRFPEEVWIDIAEHVYRPKDLVSLACSTQQSRSAVAHVLRNPHVADFRLVQPLEIDWSLVQDPTPSLCDADHPINLCDYIPWYLKLYEEYAIRENKEGRVTLCYAAFIAVRSGSPVVVHLADKGLLSSTLRKIKTIDGTAAVSSLAELSKGKGWSSAIFWHPLSAQMNSTKLAEPHNRKLF
ncbi:hypothetical protein CALVIDRAFT_504841 [Calocera viscosa TUFC12733]|uniref:Uncharacterized protein n=1 Tax=Calocera viscosa (strain TUFC12733) TaxID=1330018 RepID=A0A167HXJ3_CALVF|nr:hypothetical protein CALVIDRAFT_504841 [Calocera viscosa TUFC12733]